MEYVLYKLLSNKYNLYNVCDKISLDKLKIGFVCFLMFFILFCIMYIMLIRIE